MWNQRIKGLLLLIGSLCLFQSANAEDIQKYKIVGGFNVGVIKETDVFIYYYKRIAMDMYEGAYWKNIENHFICSKPSSFSPYRTCFLQAKKGTYLDKKYKIQSSEMLIEFDCERDRFKTVFTSDRSGSFGSGEAILRDYGDGSWTSKNESPMDLLTYVTGCVKDW